MERIEQPLQGQQTVTRQCLKLRVRRTDIQLEFERFIDRRE